MELNLDLTDRTVLLLGAAHASRRALRRYSHAGAVVRTASTPEEARRALSRPVDVVVAVADGDPAWGPVLTELRQRHLVVTEPAAAPGGQIILVGGGPGTAELMTLGARRALAEADVVLYDRLAPHEDLDELTHGAELVDVGKRPGRHAVPQVDIEAMLVDHARAGKTVVRLKGGDPFVFGRGREEVSAGAAAGIPVSVVPGVTSAVSVPAAAGIPVTHRDASRMFTVVSGHVPLTDAELAHLAGLGGTLVVLMGMGTLQQLVAGLHRVGMAPTTPLAVVERGYQVDQATTYSTLADAVSTGVLTRCSSPAVVVIGEVVRLGREAPAHIAALAEPAGATSA
ncbi:uroporphyrinogen-III C-methyltransferase [Georgenia sp. 10Sc9-8]|uniref:uroporphyrinogen-III C-methyltransferase n=1 Tax=Georgenia halotolerans TaxID=3028317 RepID=A0ABT5U281_9MICO|nr:uroporphyrinogen-III C-methyltransferase [Georgenia halotolerans]